MHDRVKPTTTFPHNLLILHLLRTPHAKSDYPLDVRVLGRLRALMVCLSANIQTNLELIIKFPILI